MSKPRKLASSNAARKCDICKCTVTGGDNSWQTHVAGIRHRRNIASCRVFGEPGHPIVSAFEHVDRPPPATYRGKDQVLLAVRGTAIASVPTASGTPRVQTASPAPTAGNINSREQSTQTSKLQQLQLQLRKHLAELSGISETYHRAVARFTLGNLRSAWSVVQEQIADSQVATQPQEAAASEQTAAAEPQQQQQVEQSQHGDHSQQQHQQQRGQQGSLAACQQYQVEMSLQEPSEIACLAVVLPDAVHRLKLTVPCQSYGPAAAATSAAVACFMASLAHHQQLQHLELAFKCDDYYSILRQGGGALDRMPGLWGKVLRTAADAMKVNCGLLELVLTSYPGQLPMDELIPLQSTLVKSRQQLRTTLLLGTHPRLGSMSLLHRLPHEVMVMVIEAAVPKPCRLLLQLPQELHRNSSSDTSSGSDTSSSSSSDSDDSSSSDSSGEDED